MRKKLTSIDEQITSEMSTNKLLDEYIQIKKEELAECK